MTTKYLRLRHEARVYRGLMRRASERLSVETDDDRARELRRLRRQYSREATRLDEEARSLRRHHD